VEQGETDDELTKLKRFANIEHMWHQEVEQTIAFMEALNSKAEAAALEGQYCELRNAFY
jgi:hypothetical protein